MVAGGAATQRSWDVHYPEIEAALKLWVKGQEARLEPITGPLIKTKAERLCTAMGLAENAIKFSNGWLEEFKNQHNIAHHVSHGKAGSVNLTNVDNEQVQVQKILDGWDLNNVFNADKTSIFWKSVQNHGLLTKGLPGKKLDKTCMTVLVMMNATGTEKICLLFIAQLKDHGASSRSRETNWVFGTSSIRRLG